MASLVELAVLTVDAVVLPFLIYSYNKATKKLKNIEDVKLIDLNDKSLDKVTEYALIKGEVQPKNNDIKSNYSKQHSGVIKVISLKKHATSWRNNPFGEDYSKELSKSVSTEPFYLTNKKSKVEIINGDKAYYILKDLETTHKEYQSSDSNIVSTVLSTIFTKDVTNGIELTEKMLKNGTILWAYGRLEKMPDNSFYLSRPLDSNFSYILTKQDRQNVIDDMKENLSVIKFFLFLFGSIGVISGGYYLYKYYKIYKEKKQRERMTQHLREERLRLERERLENNQAQRRPNQNDTNNLEQTCVLCLVNPREIILLDCGHYCLCIDCVDRLPNQNCPICRREFQSFHRCYVP